MLGVPMATPEPGATKSKATAMKPDMAQGVQPFALLTVLDGHRLQGIVEMGLNQAQDGQPFVLSTVLDGRRHRGIEEIVPILVRMLPRGPGVGVRET